MSTRRWSEQGFLARPDYDEARREYDAFAELLARHVADIRYLPPAPRTGLDSLYAHDAGVVTDRGAVVFRTGKPQRRGEGPALADALAAWGVPLLGEIGGEATAEGGDTLWLDRATLAVARGFRTNAAGVAGLRRLLQPAGVEVLEVHLPHGDGPDGLLHLRSLISLLDDDLALVHRPLLPVPLFEWLQARGVRLLDVPQEEYGALGCNVLALAPRRALMLSGLPRTRRSSKTRAASWAVRRRRDRAQALGGPTCLTRPILRG